MVVIRGTKKFLDRVGRPLSEPPPSSTVLGAWYANVLFWRPQALLFVNERTLLPILVPLAPAATVITQLRATAELVLGLHGLAGSFLAHELEATENAVLAKTANRSVLGMLNKVRATSLRRGVPRLETSSICPSAWPPCPVARCTRPTSTRSPPSPPPPTSGFSSTADPASSKRADSRTSQAGRRMSPMRPPSPSPGSRRSVPA